jgi:hypothetical protein
MQERKRLGFKCRGYLRRVAVVKPAEPAGFDKDALLADLKEIAG